MKRFLLLMLMSACAHSTPTRMEDLPIRCKVRPGVEADVWVDAWFTCRRHGGTEVQSIECGCDAVRRHKVTFEIWDATS
jgi:hypothetical protein